MKKYKFLNKKGLLMSLGTSITIVAPITTLVACGSDNSIKEFGDHNPTKGNNIEEEKSKMFQNLMLSGLSGYPLHNFDIFERIINTKTYGILPITRMNAARFTPSSEAYLGGDTKPVLEIIVKKSDIIASNNYFDTIAKQLSDYINDPSHSGQYMMKVNELSSDSLDGHNSVINSGSWKIQLFKKSNSNETIKKAIELFNNKSKMSIDLEQLRKLGGTYLYSQYSHVFTPTKSDSYGMFGTAVTPSGTYKDRSGSSENSLKSWTAFGPVNGASISQTDLDNLKNLTLSAYYDFDQKNNVFVLVCNFYTNNNDRDGDSIETINIPMPELTSFSTTLVDNNEIKNYLVNTYDFNFLNSMLQKIHLDSFTSPNIGTSKRHIINVATNVMPLMKTSKNLISNSTFFNNVIEHIKATRPNFSISFLQEALANFSGKRFESPMIFGAKTYSLIFAIEIFYTAVREYMEQNNTNNQYDKELHPTLNDLINAN